MRKANLIEGVMLYRMVEGRELPLLEVQHVGAALPKDHDREDRPEDFAAITGIAVGQLGLKGVDARFRLMVHGEPRDFRATCVEEVAGRYRHEPSRLLLKVDGPVTFLAGP